MSKGIDGLLDDYYRQRLAPTSAPAGGTTCVANTNSAMQQKISGRQRCILESVVFSVKNLTAAASTVTMEVREASITGTVLASVDIITAAGATSTDCYSQWYIAASRNAGNGDYGHLSVSFNTVQTSVVQKLNVSAWLESST
jgi:hypothetical protein